MARIYVGSEAPFRKAEVSLKDDRVYVWFGNELLGLDRDEAVDMCRQIAVALESADAKQVAA